MGRAVTVGAPHGAAAATLTTGEGVGVAMPMRVLPVHSAPTTPRALGPTGTPTGFAVGQ